MRLPIHIYEKATDGFGIFYTLEDYLFYFTLHSVLSAKYDVRTLILCIMFNHTHDEDEFVTEKHMTAFERDLRSEFAQGYNMRYCRSGNLFFKSFGRSVKSVGKIAKGCFVYIANNPVAGGLCSSALEYRWNFLAYYHNPNPFSEPIVKRRLSRGFRRALKLIDDSFASSRPLNYALLDRIFAGRTHSERNQLTDYIITKYNRIDYDAAISMFGSWENLLRAVDSMAGQEPDIKEDWEDYSTYRRMLKEVLRLGCRPFLPDSLSPEDKVLLARKLQSVHGATKVNIAKFLHIPR